MDEQIGNAASEALLAHKERIVIGVTDTMYAEMPDLQTRYGPIGRAKCLQDIRHNVEHLAPAVALNEPALFSKYVTWLRDMLGSRNVPASDVLRSLEVMRRVVHDVLAPDEAGAAARVIDAGIEVLQ
jgi:hypothetical protein